ncbi:hypothetical protein LMG19087_03647 [Ralstonia wenshanensis]|nr:hypothetical protein LMG19087_03647 [Ralstonia wenshanensis]
MRLHKNHSMKRAGEAGSQPRALARRTPWSPPSSLRRKAFQTASDGGRRTIRRPAKLVTGRTRKNAGAGLRLARSG